VWHTDRLARSVLFRQVNRRVVLLLLAWAVLGIGCVPARIDTVRYSGLPPQTGTISTQVQIVLAEPQVPHLKLGEVLVSAPGNASREQLEANVKSGAANLGADAAWIIRDDTKLFPVVFVDPWWGPVASSTGSARRVVAIAIKYR
jgi:hypothetical protein